MNIRIQKWGNSQGIRIPKMILEELNISENDELEIKTEDDIIMIKKSDSRKNIIELFEGFNGEYDSSEFEWNEPVGEEIW